MEKLQIDMSAKLKTGAKRRKTPKEDTEYDLDCGCEISGGATQQTRRGRGSRSKKQPESSPRSRSKSRSKKQSKKLDLPKTVKQRSKRSTELKHFSKAKPSMNLTELQYLAKSRGIPFGGLTKTKLIRKINNYY